MKRAATALTATAAIALLGGCGDDDPAPVATQPQTQPATATAPAQAGVEVELDAVEEGGLSFSEESLQVAAGQVTLAMGNPQSNKQPHAIGIEGGNGESRAGESVQPGGRSTVTVTLVPGDYTFFCPVGNHRQAGMEGVLVVE